MPGLPAVAVVAAVAVAVALSPTLSAAQRQVIGEVAVKFRNCTIVGSELNVTISGEERQLFRFLRVPYAEAPVGPKRFAAPEPLAEFDQPDCKVNATGDEPGGSFEHLLLRVSVRTPDLSGQRPVLVLLLGGSADFVDGAVGHEDGDAFAAGIDDAASGVVLATVGSRSGVLGNLPAGLNAGLLDQRLALRFLREAIGGFGGDPTRISLAGHGPTAAGAVGLHSVGAVGDVGDGPGFSQVVMMSGSISAPTAWSASIDVAAELDLSFAERLGCVADERRLSLDCLRNQTLQSLLDAEAALQHDDVNGSGRFAPSFNASQTTPDERWRRGGFNGSLLIGAGSGAGLALARRALRLLGGSDWSAINKTHFEAMLDRELGQYPRLHAEGGGTSISGRRFLRLALSDWPHAAFGASVQSTLARALSDFGVTCPAWLATSELQSGGSAEVFMYLLDLDSDPTAPEKAVTDVAYLLGEPLLLPNYPTEHRSLTRLMARHLAAFVTAGAPGADWSASSASSSEFMRFSADANATDAAKLSTGGFAFEPGRCPLWTAEMPLANALSGSATPPPARAPTTSKTIEQQPQPQWSAPKPVSYTVLRNTTINVIGYGNTLGQTIQTPAGKVMSQFLGLPYAKPPIGERRFKPPEKLEPLAADQTYVAISPKPACVQFGQLPSEPVLDPSEDCLYMNLWTPASAEAPVENLPVLLFLHGGFFQAGDAAANRWRGSHVLDIGNAVVVTAAYRLGPLGFLWIPGAVQANLGLRDQAMVIEWVCSRNIRRYGGSFTKVTLMGVESGAASVGFHLLAGKAQFQGAVLLSGSPNLPYLVSPSTDSVKEMHSNFTAASLHCDTFESTKTLLTCLQALNVSDIISAAADFQRNSADLPAPFIAFGPVMDNDFLKLEPWATDSLPPLPPLLLGGVSAPGNALLRTRLSSQQLQNMTRDQLQTLLADSLRHFPRFAESLSAVGLRAAANRFARFPDAGSPGVGGDGSEARLLAQALGDRHFSCPSWKFMAAVSQQPQPVFGFLLAAPAEDPPSGDPLIGATLFDDAHILMGQPAGPAKPLGDVRAQLSAFLVRSLLDFAENGNLGWEAYNAASKRVLLLRDSGDGGNATSPLRYVEDVFRGQSCAFWDQTLSCVDSPYCIGQMNPTTTATMTPTTQTPTTLTSTDAETGSTATQTGSTDPRTGSTDPQTGSTDPQTGSTATQVTDESTSTTEPPTTDSTGATLPTGPTNPSTHADTTSAPPILPSVTPPVSTVDPGTGGGLDTLAIVLIVIFSVVGVALLIGGGFLIYRFRRTRGSQSGQDLGLAEQSRGRVQNEQQQQQQQLHQHQRQDVRSGSSGPAFKPLDRNAAAPSLASSSQPGELGKTGFVTTGAPALDHGSLGDQRQEQPQQPQQQPQQPQQQPQQPQQHHQEPQLEQNSSNGASASGVDNDAFSDVEESKM